MANRKPKTKVNTKNSPGYKKDYYYREQPSNSKSIRKNLRIGDKVRVQWKDSYYRGFGGNEDGVYQGYDPEFKRHKVDVGRGVARVDRDQIIRLPKK